MKCKHENVRIEIKIEHWVNATICAGAFYERQITLDAPMALHARTICPDCHHTGSYNVYAPVWQQRTGQAGPTDVNHWPTWLRQHMQIVRLGSPTVAEAWAKIVNNGEG